MTRSVQAAVIGGGPAGLMAAEVLSRGGLQVDLYEAMPSAGRKMLVAGKGGLNLTHSEPIDQFLSYYGDRQEKLEPFLRAFGPEELRRWASDLGIETFVGSSNRVFPVTMSSSPLRRAWLARLRDSGVAFHFKHKWTGWDQNGCLTFEIPEGSLSVCAGAALLALGGASWPVTGSTGAWVPWLKERGVTVAPLKPSNCGFDVGWTDHFRSRFAGAPVKAVVASVTGPQGQQFHRQGEFVITETGVEGSLIYACSALLRDEIETRGRASLHLDLAPGYSRERLAGRLARPRRARTLASHLERSAGLKGVKAGLLWEFLPGEEASDPDRLATWIKDLPVPILASRPIEEAISSAGGVTFEALDDRLMLFSLPGIFCAGEMLDWEAPTGGYLLTACFATGRAAGLGMLDWLKENDYKSRRPNTCTASPRQTNK